MRVDRRPELRFRLVPGYQTWRWGRGVVERLALAVQRGVALDAESFFFCHAGAAGAAQEDAFWERPQAFLTGLVSYRR